MVKSGGREMPNMNGTLTLEKPLSFFPVNASTVKVIFLSLFQFLVKIDVFIQPMVPTQVTFALSGDPRQFTWDESGIFEVSSPPEEPQRVGNFQTKFHICQNASITNIIFGVYFADRKLKTRQKIKSLGPQERLQYVRNFQTKCQNIVAKHLHVLSMLIVLLHISNISLFS